MIIFEKLSVNRPLYGKEDRIDAILVRADESDEKEPSFPCANAIPGSSQLGIESDSVICSTFGSPLGRRRSKTSGMLS